MINFPKQKTAPVFLRELLFFSLDNYHTTCNAVQIFTIFARLAVSEPNNKIPHRDTGFSNYECKQIT